MKTTSQWAAVLAASLITPKIAEAGITPELSEQISSVVKSQEVLNFEITKLDRVVEFLRLDEAVEDNNQLLKTPNPGYATSMSIRIVRSINNLGQKVDNVNITVNGYGAPHVVTQGLDEDGEPITNYAPKKNGKGETLVFNEAGEEVTVDKAGDPQVLLMFYTQPRYNGSWFPKASQSVPVIADKNNMMTADFSGANAGLGSIAEQTIAFLASQNIPEVKEWLAIVEAKIAVFIQQAKEKAQANQNRQNPTANSTPTPGATKVDGDDPFAKKAS